jgi:iron complex outermembrane receptor protein
VVAFTSRMPQVFEAEAEVQGSGGGFAQYGERRTVGAGRFSGNISDRIGPAAFRLSYNHLDSWSQPLSYATALVPAASSSAGTPVSGAVPSANRLGQPMMVLGATAVEHQVQDNVSGRAAFDLAPGLTAAYAFGLFSNHDRATAASWLRDASGAPVYAGTVNIAGRAYALAPSLFDTGVYRLDELDLAQGLSLAWRTEALDLDLSTSRYDTLSSRQHAPTGSLPAAFAGGAGSDTALDGTGWTTADLKLVWRAGAGHVLSAGLHDDRITLDNPRYAQADWTGGADGALTAGGFGHTETQALWLQDVVSPAKALEATVGVRLEHWRAFGGLNVSTAPALYAQQPALHADAASPKATLAFTPAAAWTLKASVGVAYRFPTVSELYQAVTAGPILAVPSPDLKPERALSSELSAERAFDAGSLRLSLFDERITNALLSQSAPLPAGSTTLASYVQNVDRTRATGLELVGVRRGLFVPGFDLSGWVSYVDARIEADRALPAAVGKALPQVPRLRGGLTASWAAASRLDLSASARYSDRAYGTIDNSDPYAHTYQGFDAWFTVDLHARWRLNSHLVADAGVENLLGRRYFLFHPFPQRTFVADLKYSF